MADLDQLIANASDLARQQTDPFGAGFYNDLNELTRTAGQANQTYRPPTPAPQANQTNPNNPPKPQTNFFDSVAKSLGVKKETAELIVGGGLLLLAVVALTPSHRR